MPFNVGTVDRAGRVVIGILLLSLVVIGPRTAWGFLGAIPLLTGLVGYCPLYRAFRFTTFRLGSPHDSNAHS